tara:strand:- start:126 stop:404 length:279 start_codon:yes stop_codon:yes gene_type:complete
MPYNPILVVLPIPVKHSISLDAERCRFKGDPLCPYRTRQERFSDPSLFVAILGVVDMEPFEMNRIHRVLLALKPIASELPEGGLADSIFPNQ